MRLGVWSLKMTTIEITRFENKKITKALDFEKGNLYKSRILKIENGNFTKLSFFSKMSF